MISGFDDYAAIPALNWSTLKLLATSPKMLKFRETTPRKDTDALLLGRAIHCAALEPDLWFTGYAKSHDFGDLRTKAGKAARDSFAPAPRTTYLDEEQFDLAERCAAAIRGHKEAMGLLGGGRREETVQWVDKETGLKCKCRFDNIRPNDSSDIKSTRHCTPRAFLRDASSLLYHGQLAWYHDGAIAAGLLPETAELPGVVAVQTTEPYDVFPFRMTRAAYWAGQSLWKSLIKRYAECQAAEWWPGAAPGVLDFDVMPWAETGDEEKEEEKW